MKIAYSPLVFSEPEYINIEYYSNVRYELMNFNVKMCWELKLNLEMFF